MKQQNMKAENSFKFVKGCGLGVVMAVFFVLAMICTVPVTFAEDARPADFGKQWVRNHPFTIQAAINLDKGLEYYEYFGMTSASIWKSSREDIFEKVVSQNLPWDFYAFPNLLKCGYPFSETTALEEAKRFYSKYPGGMGFIIWDEPRHPAFPIMAGIMQKFRTTFPDALVYSNLYSAGASSGK